MPSEPAPQNSSPLFNALTPFVTKCMAQHDPSHNPAHVHRVVSLARKILNGERARRGDYTLYDDEVVDLAALLHDIGDRKYLGEVRDVIRSLSSSSTSGQDEKEEKKAEEDLNPQTLIQQTLLSHGAGPVLASRVQTIVSHVSYTTEKKNPSAVHDLINSAGYSELAIVQDADRLDALGAVGIGRCFTFLGAQGKKHIPADGAWEMGNSIEHFQEKLERLEGMMKTETGREMARERTRRIVEFRGWWEEEMALTV